jgi:CheY-like chemotaxis protein
MSRILLADDSPHAQRMGERILREEGYEVVSLTDGETALLRLEDVDPDVILADVFLPGKSGFDICRYVKSHPRHRHVRVVMTAGLLERFDEGEAKNAGCDGILKKPFEASLLVRTIKPLVSEAHLSRGMFAEEAKPGAPAPNPAGGKKDAAPKPSAEIKEAPKPPPADTASPQPAAQQAKPSEPAPPPSPQPETAPAPVAPAMVAPAVDAERVRAAVTVALDAALPALIDEITERVLIALGH